jgi:hypothetical protein
MANWQDRIDNNVMQILEAFKGDEMTCAVEREHLLGKRAEHGEPLVDQVATGAKLMPTLKKETGTFRRETSWRKSIFCTCGSMTANVSMSPRSTSTFSIAAYSLPISPEKSIAEALLGF